MDIPNNGIKLETEKIQRPWLITILCLFGFIICLQLFLVIILLILAKNHPAPAQNLLWRILFTFIFKFMGFINYWKMKKSGIFLYFIGAMIGNQNLFTFQGYASVKHYVIPIIILSIGLLYYKRMR